jgi:PleD family two-component response regulator
MFRFNDLKLLDQITTLPNPRALISLCADVANNVLAVPGVQKGA